MSDGKLIRRTWVPIALLVSAAVVLGFFFVRINPAAATAESDIDALPLLQLVQELRIGDVNDPVRGFSQIGGVVPDRDGNIYVLERQGVGIRVFSSEGNYLRSIGAQGDGPGEFSRLINRMGVKGDTVWAVEYGDYLEMRVSLFARDGRLLQGIRGAAAMVPSHFGSGLQYPMHMQGDGKFVADVPVSISLGYEGRPDIKDTDTLRLPRIVYSTDLTSADTVGWYHVYPDAVVVREQVTVEGRKIDVPLPPVNKPLHSNTLDGFLSVIRDVPPVADRGSIIVTRLSMAGDTIFTRELNYVPSQYSSALLDSIAARAAAATTRKTRCDDTGCRTTEGTSPPQIATALRARMRFPGFTVPVDWVVSGADTSVWLRRSDAGGASIGWIVLSPTGEPVGRVEIPKGVRPIYQTQSEIYAIVPDENDVPFLVKYRLGRGNVRN